MGTNSNIQYNNILGGSTPPIGGSPAEFQAWLAAQNAQLQPVVDNRQALIDYASRPQEPIQSEMLQRDANLFGNALKEAREIGTGFANLAVHRDEIVPAIRDYIASNPIYARDFANAMLSSYETKVEDFGKLSAKEIAQNIVRGAYKNPLSTTFDLLSLGAGRVIGAALPWVKNTTKVERGVNVVKAEVAQRGQKIYDGLAEAKKIAEETGADYAKAVEAIETGKTVTGPEKQVFRKLQEVSDEMDAMYRDYSPETYIGSERMAMTQQMLRKRIQSDPTVTFAQVEREATPLFERIAAGDLDGVKQLAKEGDVLAKEVIGAKALYDKGRIKPITHGLANVEKVAEETVQRLNGNVPAIFTRRVYGNSSYDDIVKQLKNPDEFLEGVLTSNIDKAISRDLLNGAVGGQDIASKTALKDMVYLNRELLQRGDLQGALTELRKNKVLADDIPVNKYFAKALKDQRDVGGALHGFAKDMYNTGKGVLMAAGGYLGPNAITGAANAIINSNIGLLGDIYSAIKSQGRISQSLGTYRRGNLPQYTNTPILRQIQQLNRLTGGGLFQRTDRAIQNVFSEIAAHAEMRKRGVKFGDRFDYATQADKAKLGELITDVNRTALINSPNVPLPKALQDVAFVANPFWRWQATAAQSGLRMLEKNGVLANTVLMDIMANIGFDREMQNRLNLGVRSDKPFVSYRVNQYTGKIEEVSAETLPIVTSLKFLSGGDDFKPTIPVISSLIGALGGVDKYGRPLTRPEQNGVITQTIGTKRFQSDPYTGELKEVQGGFGDEILTSAIKDLVGLPTLYNRTAGPIASYFVGDGQFYQPYGSSLFGSFTPANEGNILVGGDPVRGRMPIQVIEGLSGIYGREYYPSREEEGLPISQRVQRQFTRNYVRRQNRASELGAY